MRAKSATFRFQPELFNLLDSVSAITGEQKTSIVSRALSKELSLIVENTGISDLIEQMMNYRRGQR